MIGPDDLHDYFEMVDQHAAAPQRKRRVALALPRPNWPWGQAPSRHGEHRHDHQSDQNER